MTVFHELYNILLLFNCISLALEEGEWNPSLGPHIRLGRGIYVWIIDRCMYIYGWFWLILDPLPHRVGAQGGHERLRVGALEVKPAKSTVFYRRKWRDQLSHAGKTRASVTVCCACAQKRPLEDSEDGANTSGHVRRNLPIRSKVSVCLDICMVFAADHGAKACLSKLSDITD